MELAQLSRKSIAGDISWQTTWNSCTLEQLGMGWGVD